MRRIAFWSWETKEELAFFTKCNRCTDVTFCCFTLTSRRVGLDVLSQISRSEYRVRLECIHLYQKKKNHVAFKEVNIKILRQDRMWFFWFCFGFFVFVFLISFDQSFCFVFGKTQGVCHLSKKVLILRGFFFSLSEFSVLPT